MHRIPRFWKDETAAFVLQFVIQIALIMAAAVAIVFLVGRLAGWQWMAVHALLP